MKAYTDIPQSKVLAEILPLESADMSWVEKGNAKRTWYDAENKRITTKYEKKYYIPCWSLPALLNVLPSATLDSSDDHHYRVHCRERFTEWHDNAVDACVEMILKLHKEELL